MNTIFFRLFFFLSVFSSAFCFAQIPDKPSPQRLVNDFAGIYTREQTERLEAVLSKFNDSTSNQIVIVSMADLNGIDKAEMAYSIGEKWGVGQKDTNNGMVILIKPKNSTKGEVFIATGYGLEGAFPDALVRNIIEGQMIPYFKNNDYYGGTVAALNRILPIASGEYNYALEKGKPVIGLLVFFGIFILIVVILSIFSKKGGDHLSGEKSQMSPFLTALLLGSLLGGSRGGSWGGGGRSGGGFGGFGGGGFGGGGAGGSW